MFIILEQAFLPHMLLVRLLSCYLIMIHIVLTILEEYYKRLLLTLVMMVEIIIMGMVGLI